MRGGYVRSQVVFSKRAIDSPMCENPDYFVALSSAAYNRFKQTVTDDGVILYDPAFVEAIDPALGCRQLSLPAKKLAIEELGRPIYANSIALGAMAFLLRQDLAKEVVLESMLAVIPKYQQENRRAFRDRIRAAGLRPTAAAGAGSRQPTIAALPPADLFSEP